MAEQEKKQESPVAERRLKISCHNCMQKLDVTSLQPFSHVNCPTCGMELIVPKWFDDYLLEEPGGTGGMATVYRALDLALDREVAIKILKPELSRDSAKSELFLREARTAATINHYAVVPIYTCGVCGDQTYIIMQFMGGGSLEQKLRQSPEPLPLLDIMRWISDIAQGLENASIHGIVHHDVKPGNILLDVEGNAKIGDFGIAQIIAGPDGKNSETKNWISPFYVSPEKVRTGEEGIQGDIYSLGATAYHLVTGMPPFNHDDLDELIRMRLTKDPTPPHLLRKDTGLELSQLILSMMNRNPMERPSYKTITAILVRIIKEQSSSTVPLPVRTFRRKREAFIAARTRKARTSAAAVLCIGIFLFLAVAGGGFLFWKNKVTDHEQKSVQRAAKEVPFRMNLSQASVYHFSMGSPEAAFICAEAVWNDPRSSLHDRSTALFQEACALYLMNDPDAAAKIEQQLASMNNQYSASEMMRENLLISLSMNLSNPASDEPIPDAEGVGGVCKAFVPFLLALRSGAEDERLVSLLTDFQTAAQTEDNAWPSAAWLKRSERWMQILRNHSGVKGETEPVLADRITTEDSWSGGIEDLLPATPESWMEEESVNWDDVPEEEADAPLDVSPEVLKAAASAYANRPRLKSPSLLQTWNADAYLASLPEEKQIPEKIRIRMMKEMPRFISEISAPVLYQADSFTLADNSSLDAGLWMFNPWFMICRSDAAAKFILWENAPAQEILSILLFYTARMEGICRHRDSGTRHLLMYYMRYALFALWYENFEEASKYIRKAMTAFPDKKTAAFIRFMFLQ